MQSLRDALQPAAAGVLGSPPTPDSSGSAKRSQNPNLDDFEIRRRRALVRSLWGSVPQSLLGRPVHEKFGGVPATWSHERSMLLLGPTGCGKSSTLVAVVAQLCKRAVHEGEPWLSLAQRTAWILADDLATAGRTTDDEDARRLLHRAEFCAYLILDDVSALTKTAQVILRKRCDKDRPTAITSGHNLERFAEAVGGKAVGRWFLEGGKTRGEVFSAW